MRDDPAPPARLVQRRLTRPIDPAQLYAALCDRKDTALFEGNEGTTLLLERASVRAECRGSEVRLNALTANGESLLRALGGNSGEPLILSYPLCHSHDAADRLRAPAPLDSIRRLLAAADGRSPFAALALGVIGFDHATVGEELPDDQDDPLGAPDYLFWIAESLILFEPGAPPRLLCAAFPDPDPGRARRNHHDAVDRLAALVAACEAPLPPLLPPIAPADPGEVAVDLDDAAYCALVSACKERIAAGEVYQIVPSRTFSAPCHDPFAAYLALRTLEPNSYRFFARAPGFTLFGASPETAVRVTRDRMVELRPIAGTRPRGCTPDEDDRFEAELRLDDKELAEHMMLVDLARNDVARVSAPGTRRVANLLTVERYARVMHLVSSVTGRLADGLDAFHALAACLNVGTLVGAPKLRATALLRAGERTRRGPYGGAVGWMDGAGAADSAVVIRSALVRDDTAYVRVGAGVVHDSVPQAEADETRRKASALLSILAGAER